MFNFILKNAGTKKSKLILTALTIIIACTVGILSVNISNQVDDGIIELSDGYDIVIGPEGSDSQLAFNALFFSEDPLGTVNHSVLEQLESDLRVNKVIPFAMADTYGMFRIVGTTPEFTENYKLTGENFTEKFESVIGHNVAEKTGLKVGDTFFSTHGAMGSQHNQPITVVGILEETKTNYDNVIFTEINTVFGLHSHSDENHTETTTDADHNESEEHDEHDEHDEDAHGLTAILVRTKSIQDQARVLNEYDEMHGIQAITPTAVLRDTLSSIDMSKQIVFALTAIIFAMSIVLLFIITMLTAQDLKSDIKLLRYLGVSNGKIASMFTCQYLAINSISLIISLLLSHIALHYVNSVSTGYGIVIDATKIYSVEYAILAVMLIVSLIPIVSYIINCFRKDISVI